MIGKNTTSILLIAGGIILSQFSDAAYGQPVNKTDRLSPPSNESSHNPELPVIPDRPDSVAQPERTVTDSVAPVRGANVLQPEQSRSAAPEIPTEANIDSTDRLTGDSPTIDSPKKETAVLEESVSKEIAAIDPLIARGRYLSTIAGCNDCHTAGFAPSGGSMPEKDWLLGDAIGFRGPWGTTYSSNLRYYLSGFSEEQWIVVARNLKSRPPMSSYSLNQMEEDDLRAIYRFVKSLGEKGGPGPSYVPPGTEPKTRYIVYEPVAPNKSR